MPHHISSLPRSAALISSMMMFSRLLGLVRDMALAWLLGGTPAADALVIAMRLPHMIRRLLGEGSLSMSVTAALTRISWYVAMPMQYSPKDIQDKNTATCGTPSTALLQAAVTRALHWRLAVTLGGIMLLLCLLAEPLTYLLSPQADPAVLTQAAPLLQICLPYALTASLAALGMGLLHSQQQFFLPSLAPILFNCAVLSAAGLAAFGIGEVTLLLAGGMLGGGFLQWISQRIAVASLWRSARCIHIDSSTIWRILRGIPLGALGAAAPQIVMLCATVAASALPSGSVAGLYYAERLLEVPLGILTVGLGMAGLPVLARLAAENNYAAFTSTTENALRWSLLLTLPAATGLAAIAEQLVILLLGHGAFDERAANLATLALLGYLPALPACGLIRPLLAACHAYGLSTPPLCSALASAGFAGLITLVWLGIGGDESELLLLTLGMGASLWLQPLCLWYTLNRALQSQGLRLCLALLPLLQITGAALCAGLMARAVLLTIISPLWGLCLAVPAGISSYAAILLLLHNTDALDILYRMRLWWRKR